jgi:hypothetical protein
MAALSYGDTMNVLDLFEEVRAATNAGGTKGFEVAFLSALKKVVSDLNRKLVETIVAPDSLDPVEIGFEDYCDNVFHPGIKFYMQRAGQWAQDPDGESRNFYEMELRKVIGAAIDAETDFKTRNQEE